jgi:hypothetical protein
MSKIAYPTMSPVAGVKLDKPSQFLLKAYSPDSLNMELYDGVMRARLGLIKEVQDALGDPVMRIDTYKKFDGTFYLMLCTTLDIFYVDTGKPIYITPKYDTGTVAVTNGSAIVTGAGTTWVGNVKPGDRFRIGAYNAGTFASQVWYQVQSVDSNTQITLTAAYAQATASGQTYTIRKVFTGGATDFWDSCEYTDNVLGKVWAATNGVDPFVYWNGANQVVTVTGSPPLAKYLVPFKDHLFLLWCKVAGLNQPLQIQWNAAGNLLSWPGTSVEYLVDTPGEITGAAKLGFDYLAVFKESSKYLGRFVGGDFLFDFELRDASIGCLSRWSIVSTQDAIYYYGSDSRFRAWNGVQDDPISDNFLPYLRTLDPNWHRYTYGIRIEHLKQIRWFVAKTGFAQFNACLVYDYDDQILEPWEYSSANFHGVPGVFELEQDLYVDDPVWGEYFVDDQVGYWDDRNFLANAPIILIGGKDGFLRRADVGKLDDGVSFTARFRSVKMDYDRPFQVKRIFSIEPWFYADTTGTVTYRARLNDKTSFQNAKTFTLIEAGKDVVKKSQIVDYNAHTVEHEYSSTDHFELLGWYSYIAPKTVRR